MVRSYWKRVHRRAFDESRRLLHIESRQGLVIAVIVSGLLLAGLWYWAGKELAQHELIVRVGGAVVIALVFPILYVVKLFTVPARMDAEANASSLTGDKKKEIRIALGRLLAGGQEILPLCANEKVPPPTETANQWAQEAETFMFENLDESYVARFRDGHGLPMMATQRFSIPHRNLEMGIRVRMARLQEFMKELS